MHYIQDLTLDLLFRPVSISSTCCNDIVLLLQTLHSSYIVDVFGSLPPTQLNIKIYLHLKINDYQITVPGIAFTGLHFVITLDQLNQVLSMCGKHGRSVVIPVLLDSDPYTYMVENFLSGRAKIYLTTQLHIYIVGTIPYTHFIKIET